MTRQYKRISPALTLLICMWSSSAAKGSELVSSSDGAAQVSEVKAFFTNVDDEQIIVEQIHIKGQAQTIGWIRAFPQRPQVTPGDPELFSELNRLSRVDSPHYLKVQDDISRPSLVLGIYRQLTQDEVEIIEEEAVEDLDFNALNFSTIESEVVSSTISQTRSFPRELNRWLEANEFTLSPVVRRKLMQYCEMNWYLVFGIIDSSSLQEKVAGRIPAIEYRFRSEQTVHPSLLISGKDVRMEYWNLSEKPLVPSGRVLNLEGRLEKAVEKENHFEVSYHQMNDDGGFVSDQLSSMIGDTPKTHLVRGKLNPGSAVQRVQAFEEKLDLPLVPQQTSRGGFTDLIFCFFLGIAPIFLLPESWVFYWLRHQGKLERTRVNPNPVATKLWPLYCLFIGGFWLVTQIGAGKIAAILPLLFGLLALRTQETPQGRVIVTFKKPKKTVRSSQTP